MVSLCTFSSYFSPIFFLLLCENDIEFELKRIRAQICGKNQPDLDYRFHLNIRIIVFTFLFFFSARLCSAILCGGRKTNVAMAVCLFCL